ncbi:uncharacterized protein BXZ73DRAFT_95728 [Epithele typhae]|uniref:uncharacterized protein n=1 Tax=Epithele typhae TaxID=378194 RepID=UPI0020074F2E|nr:uncharacterized protein BXZ73DRAFT_95728 [Epithele typhae]KAH9946227.1 hypothetical protein BXZ73DRAFT_95728 [Epithele typhae]
MTYTTNDTLVLAAPRPVRLASGTAPFPFHPIAHRPRSRAAFLSAAADAFDRLRLSDDPDHYESKPSDITDKENHSPRASPRSTPSEALEEFLSILQHQSAIRIQPTSPVIRASNHFFYHRRQTPSSLSPSLPSDGLALAIGDDADVNGGESITYSYKFIGNALGSPVSRVHTRNPFQRHPSYDGAVAGLLGPPLSPSPAQSLTPAAIPLPLPTPDEMELEAFT